MVCGDSTPSLDGLEHEHREAVLRFTAYPLIILTTLNGVALLAQNQTHGWLLVGAAAVGALVMRLRHRMGRPAFVAHFLVGILVGSLTCLNSMHGGIGFGASYTLAVVPLYAFLLLGSKAGLAWGGIAAAELIVLSVAHQMDVQFSLTVSHEESKQLSLLSVWVQFLILTGIGAAYDWLRRSKQERLQLLATKLDQSRREAEHASEAKSVFLANMSHEIRTPMHGVAGTLQLLSRRPDAPERDAWIDSAQRSCLALRQVLDDIIDLSKIEAGKMRLEAGTVEPHRIGEDTRALFQAESRRCSVELSVEVDDDVPRWLTGDPVRLRQIVNNLVSNAIKFSNPALRNRHQSGRVQLRLAWLETGLLLVVEDDGIGIPLEAQGRILEPFEQADDSTTRRYGGTGLGLAIISRLIRQMGGHLELESTPGQGTLFRVQLPLTEALPPSDPEHADVDLLRLEGLRVLVAEDNPTNQVIISAMLEQLRMEVEVVENGEAALERLREQGFDLVLMDCHMPVMDGFAATRAIRKEKLTEGTPVIALTASALLEDRERCLESGMHDVLTKPIEFDTLAVALSAWAHRGS